jgi:hypothetical protein
VPGQPASGRREIDAAQEAGNGCSVLGAYLQEAKTGYYAIIPSVSPGDCHVAAPGGAFDRNIPERGGARMDTVVFRLDQGARIGTHSRMFTNAQSATWVSRSRHILNSRRENTADSKRAMGHPPRAVMISFFPNHLGIDTRVYIGSAELATVCALLGRIPGTTEYL